MNSSAKPNLNGDSDVCDGTILSGIQEIHIQNDKKYLINNTRPLQKDPL